MEGFLEYVPGNSVLHRLNPVAKLAAAVIFAIACFCADSLLLLGVLLAAGLVLAASCGMVRQVVGLMKAVLAFSLLLAVLLVLTTPTGLPLLGLPWGYVGTGSLRAATAMVLRLEAAAIPLFLVFYVTKLTDLSNALCQTLGVPYRYAFAFTSTVRFIPVFMNDMRAIMEAQTARGVEFDTGGLVKKVRLMVPLCVPLLVQSVRKTNSAAIAAEARGFALRTRESGFKRYQLTAADAAALAASLALVVLAVLCRVCGVA